MSDKQEQIRETTERLMEMFRSGAMPEKVALTFIHRAAGDTKPSDKWSIGNKIISFAYGADDARGFHQWREVERNVKKGSKAFCIFAPLTKKVKDENTQEEKILVYGFKAVPVFRYEDTEGKDLPQFNYAPAAFPPFYDVAAALGIPIRYVPKSGSALGSFNTRSNSIKLSSQDAFVYFHELAHSVHHSFVNLKSIDLSRAEAVAEISACVLSDMQGISGFEKHAYKYVEHYSQDKDPEAVLKFILSVLNEVGQVVEKILTTAESISNQGQVAI